MNNNKKTIMYYYCNILLALTIMITSYIYVKPSQNLNNIVDDYKNNVLEVEQVNKTILNLKSNNNYDNTKLKIYNNGKIKLNYKLIYRVHDTNLDTEKLILLINDNYYNYNNIITVKNDEYTEILIYSSDIEVGSTNEVNFAFIYDGKYNSNLYINGDYIVESLNSLVVFK